jgi:hypothetical protein
LISIAPKGLTEEESDALKDNLRQLNAKRKRALIRDAYYDGKRRLDAYGISIPPQMRDLESVVGWPAKACDALSARLHLGGFVMPGQSQVNSDIADIFRRNRMAVEWPQAQVSTFINGAAFGAVMPGDVSDGEPEVLILMLPATEATGMWDVRRRGLRSAIWLQVEERKPVSRAALFLQSHTVQMYRDDVGNWELVRVANPLPRVGVTPLAYRPRMGRPFGMSRISRPVMSHTTAAVRTILRSEVSAEFYSSPQRWAMGADEDSFTDEDGNIKTAWETVIGNVWAMPRDEDGNLPSVGQFQQSTQQPHIDQLRSIAMMFAGETSLPPSSLGIIHDNPASAEAIDAAWADMVGVAEMCQVELGVAAVEIAQNALMLADKTYEITDELSNISAKWRDASTPTRAAMTDATVKQIAAGVLRPDSEVALEQLGYDQTDIQRIIAEHRAGNANSPIAELNGLLNQQAAREPVNSDVPA